MRLLPYSLLGLIGLTIIACQPAVENAPSLTVSNSSALDFQDSPIIIPMAKINSLATSLGEGEVLAPHDEDGALIPFQYDDLDRDGKVDELLFLVDLSAGKEKVITFKAVAASQDFPFRTQVHLGKKSDQVIQELAEATRLDTWDNKITQSQYQFEGPGWENDRVGFRNYFDRRNGIDIFGKIQSALVLDQVGVGSLQNYHELKEWGMDILKVGSSLGAGSAALWYQDSLIRLSSPEADFQLLCEGPLRSTFQLGFRGVDLGDKKIDVEQLIYIYAGTYAYESSLSLSDAEEIQVVSGIVDLHQLPSHSLSDESSEVLYTYGYQTENQDSLGMALMAAQVLEPVAVDTDSLAGEIPDSYALLLSPPTVRYRFYAAWEPSNPQFASQAGFEAYLKSEMGRFAKSPTLTWQ